MKKYAILVLKGIGMGVANVIPGVSGGTIALLTGIFEELIGSIKSFNLKAVKLLFSGKIKDLVNHINLWFLIAVFGGAFIGIASLAKLLEYLFVNYPIYIWSYFFGLVLASTLFVAKTIVKWKIDVIIAFIVGTGIALTISFLTPATQNDSYLYLALCGVVAICSMILPGLSGSFVLVLMGNYKLVMVDAVNDFNIKILAPVAIGAGVGIIAFSHVLSWLFKKFKDQTIAILCGFILGSLAIVWPWKNSFDIDEKLISVNEFGAYLDGAGQVIQEKVKVSSYSQILPESLNMVVGIAIALMLVGFVTIWILEKFAATKESVK